MVGQPQLPAQRGSTSHGNGGNIIVRRDGFRTMHGRVGASTLAVDYRGFGQGTGRPSESATYADGRAAVAEALRRPNSQDLQSRTARLLRHIDGCGGRNKGRRGHPAGRPAFGIAAILVPGPCARPLPVDSISAPLVDHAVTGTRHAPAYSVSTSCHWLYMAIRTTSFRSSSPVRSSIARTNRSGYMSLKAGLTTGLTL
jgi:hypothetical protein